jgi:hypothetical protein
MTMPAPRRMKVSGSETDGRGSPPGWAAYTEFAKDGAIIDVIAGSSDLLMSFIM